MVLQKYCQSWLKYGFCAQRYLSRKTCLRAPSNEMGERESSFVYPSDVSDISCDQNSYSDIEEESDESFLARENDGTESIPCPFLHSYPAELSKRDRYRT